MARVLCLHGLGGTGATMWPVVGRLAALGHLVFAPTLPGHGGEPEALFEVGFADWIDAARQWPADVVVGQSMGGSLALVLAAEQRCRAVVAINAVLGDPDALDGIDWRRSRGQEWHEVGPSPVGEFAHERLPFAALVEMHRGLLGLDLSRITVPTLVITADHDDVVDPATGDAIAAAVAGAVERVRLGRGGHVATLDADRERLADAIVEFVAERA
jgi:carboxylesterase